MNKTLLAILITSGLAASGWMISSAHAQDAAADNTHANSQMADEGNADATPAPVKSKTRLKKKAAPTAEPADSEVNSKEKLEVDPD